MKFDLSYKYKYNVKPVSEEERGEHVQAIITV